MIHKTMSRNYHVLPIIFLFTAASIVVGQTSKSPDKQETLPKEMCGYKVQRAQVELKKSSAKDQENSQEVGEILLQLGEAKLIEVTPMGVTLEVPVVLAAVKQEGDIDRLVFENMQVNDIPVSLDDYAQPFKLPNKEALTLAPPLRIFVSTPQAVLRAVDDLLDAKDVWPVTGRIYVCGRFKKLLLKFKRAVPVDIQTSINNPLK